MGNRASLILLARIPTTMMTYARWLSMAWTSRHPLGLSGSWVPASSASSTQSLIAITIALGLPWLAKALCYPVTLVSGRGKDGAPEGLTSTQGHWTQLPRSACPLACTHLSLL